jgi:SanA protein
MYRALHVHTISSATIVTQEFHLPRALFIAKRLGINAHGFVASGKEGITDAYLREIPATIKAIFDVSVRRQPETI